MNKHSDESLPSPSGQPHGAADGLPLVAPDAVEQDEPETIDNIVPSHGYQMTPMVGLGGSAGAIAPITEFFRSMPADSGMVFVVILHLSPVHDSALVAVLQSHTSMPVKSVTDGQSADPNTVYVIPPGKYVTCADGQFRLTGIEAERGRRVAVDMFFRSLADTHGPHAVAVVFSGMDGDGAQGIKRVKERGGLTIAQDPLEAEHAGMPRSAIETGMIDWVLRSDQVAQWLIEYGRTESRLKLPSEEDPKLPVRSPSETDDREAALREVLVFLRSRTGRDFSQYKRATVLRRIARRMQVNGVDELGGYMSYLRTHPGEAGALLQDLLISVTNFFRDRDHFEALEKLLPRLFEWKSSSDSVRVWVPACATGEEAYSLAVILLEHAQRLDNPPSIQVFACDLNDEAIRVARTGYYSATIEADVSEQRLKRFFVKEHKGYRVRREVREMVLFATHDLLKDAPFSRMDLISCRNLLIYLGREAQQRVLDTFHFAMKPGGVLFLGSSETVDENSPMFGVLDKKHRIFYHRPSSRSSIPVPSGPSTLVRAIQAHEHAKPAPVVHGKLFEQAASVVMPTQLARDLNRAALAELHFKLIERYGPPSIIVNQDLEIVHLSEHAGEFLQFGGGEPSMNLVRIINPSLRVDLRAALFRAVESGTPAEALGIQAEIGGQMRRVDIHVSLASEIAPGFLLVVLRSQDTPDTERSTEGAAESRDSVTRLLERELEQVKRHLRDTVEQYEASTEELKASNEELQAMNEELRSATEELETSREELQSINEELSTVNQEMKSKVDELANANSDLQNLMASTSIATVFLDRHLMIMRFTPNAAGIFNMIPGDIGRPLEHLKHKLDYPDLIPDAEKILKTLVPIEREVSDGERWFLATLRPYRTLEDHIAGAVLTLVDITDRTRANEALRQSEERMRMLIESATDWAIFTFNTERRVNGWNSGAEAVFGFSENEILGQSSDVLFTAEDREHGVPAAEAATAVREGRAQNERWHIRKDGSLFYGSGSVMPLRDNAGGVLGFVKIMRDLTERKRTQEAIREHVEELERFNKAAVGRETRMIELKKEINELCSRIGEADRYVIDEPPSRRTSNDPPA
jgi:two-component system CheB/CheR fusion protein